MMNIQNIFKEKKLKKTKFYDDLCDEFHVNFTYPTLCNWLSGTKPMKNPSAAWIIYRAIKEKLNIEIKITDILFPEGVSDLEAKFRKAA